MRTRVRLGMNSSGSVRASWRSGSREVLGSLLPAAQPQTAHYVDRRKRKWMEKRKKNCAPLCQPGQRRYGACTKTHSIVLPLSVDAAPPSSFALLLLLIFLKNELGAKFEQADCLHFALIR